MDLPISDWSGKIGLYGILSPFLTRLITSETVSKVKGHRGQRLCMVRDLDLCETYKMGTPISDVKNFNTTDQL